LSTGSVIALDALGSMSYVPNHISQICQDSQLESLLTDDVHNLSVRFRRVKVTGEDITGVEC